MNALQKKYGAEYAQQNHPHKPHCHVQFVGFPCNQFGYQEPAENHELMNCIKHVRPGFGFEPLFPVSGKLEVNGAGESPLFTFLKARCPAPFGLIANRTDITWTPIRNNDISWNFQKWLVDHNGDPIKRFTSRTDPVQTEDDIVALINKCVGEGGDNATKPIDIAALKPGAGPQASPAAAPAAAVPVSTGPPLGGIPSADEAQHAVEAEAAAKEAALKAATNGAGAGASTAGAAGATGAGQAVAAAKDDKAAAVTQANGQAATSGAAAPAAGSAAQTAGAQPAGAPAPAQKKKRSLFDVMFH